MPYESGSAASEVSLAWFGLRIIRVMQPSAVRNETAECVALRGVSAACPTVRRRESNHALGAGPARSA
jgi:hypothetical protein